MGVGDSKEQNTSQSNQNPANDLDPNNANKSIPGHGTPDKQNVGKAAQFKGYDEEDKYADNTQSSITDNDVINSQRGSNLGTPFRGTSKRKQVFTAMTSRVLYNKENRKGLSNLSNRYNHKNTKNVDGDGIEWVPKQDIIETTSVSSRPYGSKHTKSINRFEHGSKSRSRLIKAKSGVMTFLPSSALATIISYDMSGFRKYMSVCANWHVNINEAFDKYFNSVENEFIIKYQSNLLFTESFTSSAAIQFCGKRGLRVDRILVCDILPFKPQLNRTLKISYTFRYHGEDTKKKYRAEYRIDILKNRKRMIWMHVDRETECTYQQTIFQSCTDDTIELALHLFSLRGLVDVESIVWSEPEIYETPSINTLTYNKDMVNVATADRAIKIYADINRVCELEDTVVEWYDEKYYENKSEILNFDFLKDMFELT